MVNRKKARICFFLYSLRGGGVEKVAVTTIKELLKRGCEIDLILVNKTGTYIEELPREVRVVTLVGVNNFFIPTLSRIPSLVSYLWRVRPEVVISSFPRNNITLLLASFFAPKSIFYIVREHASMAQVMGQFGSIKGFTVKTLIRILYPHADKIITVSKGLALELETDFYINSSKIQTIYNPVDVIDIQKKARAMIPVENFFYSDKTIVATGRLVEQKNFSMLVQVVSMLRDEGNDVSLIILGEGPEKKRLMEYAKVLRIEKHVFFPGFVKNPYAFMSRGSVFILSSNYEGFGNVLVEALACGVPVISTNCPSGPAEILGDGKYGLLTPVNDEVAMYNAVKQVLYGSLTKTTKGTNRAKNFDVSEIVDQYLAVFHSGSSRFRTFSKRLISDSKSP